MSSSEEPSKYNSTIQFTTNSNQEETFKKFKTSLPDILSEIEYDELWGYQLTAEGEFYEKAIVDSILYKFLKANDFDLTKAKDQLSETLKWRKEFQPLRAAFVENHDDKFKAVGVITYYEDIPEIITWNLYGENEETDVPDSKKRSSPGELFEDLDAFLRYRISLMERSLQLCQFTEPRLSKISQVHDYKNVSFLKFDPRVKTASKKIIKTFQDYYPELLERKFFVNVPWLAQWVYDLIVFTWLPTETSRKFKILSNPLRLAKEAGTSGVPVRYGGMGGKLNEQNYDFDSNKDFVMTPYTKHLIESGIYA